MKIILCREKSYGGDSDDSGESYRKELDKQARFEEKQLINEQFQLRRGAKKQDNEVTKNSSFLRSYN